MRTLGEQDAKAQCERINKIRVTIKGLLMCMIHGHGEWDEVVLGCDLTHAPASCPREIVRTLWEPKNTPGRS